MYMEVTVELLDLTICLHLFTGINCVSRLALLAQVLTSQDLGVFHVSHAMEVIDNPLVELVSPVGKDMGHVGIGLAGSSDTLA